MRRVDTTTTQSKWKKGEEERNAPLLIQKLCSMANANKLNLFHGAWITRLIFGADLALRLYLSHPLEQSLIRYFNLIWLIEARAPLRSTHEWPNKSRVNGERQLDYCKCHYFTRGPFISSTSHFKFAPSAEQSEKFGLILLACQIIRQTIRRVVTWIWLKLEIWIIFAYAFDSQNKNH